MGFSSMQETNAGMTVGQSFDNMHQKFWLGFLQTIFDLPLRVVHHRIVNRAGNGLISFIDLMCFK